MALEMDVPPSTEERGREAWREASRARMCEGMAPSIYVHGALDLALQKYFSIPLGFVLVLYGRKIECSVLFGRLYFVLGGRLRAVLVSRRGCVVTAQVLRSGIYIYTRYATYTFSSSSLFCLRCDAPSVAGGDGDTGCGQRDTAGHAAR